MTARGKILREPNRGTGLLMIDGRQYPFSIDGIWRSEILAKAGLEVEVEFDKNLQITGITALPKAQMARQGFFHRVASRLFSRMLSCLMFFTIASGLLTAEGQSIWQQMKQAAKEAQEAQNGLRPLNPPAGTKVEEKVLGPAEQGTRFYLSPHGVHVAVVTTSGSRAVVLYDGVEGPITGMAFTPDSKHLLWTLETADYHFRAYIDGEPVFEAARPTQGTELNNMAWWEPAADGTISFLARDETSLKRITVTPSPESNLDALLGGTLQARK